MMDTLVDRQRNKGKNDLGESKLTAGFYRKEDIFCSWKSCLVEIGQQNLTVLKNSEAKRQVLKQFIIKDILVLDVKRYGSRTGFKIVSVGNSNHQIESKKSNRKFSQSGACYYLTFQAEQDALTTYLRIKQQMELKNRKFDQNKENMVQPNFCQQKHSKSPKKAKLQFLQQPNQQEVTTIPLRKQSQLILTSQQNNGAFNTDQTINKIDFSANNHTQQTEQEQKEQLKCQESTPAISECILQNIQHQNQPYLTKQVALCSKVKFKFQQDKDLIQERQTKIKYIITIKKNSERQYKASQQGFSQFKQSHHLTLNQILIAKNLEEIKKRRQKLMESVLKVINQQQRWNPNIDQQTYYKINDNQNQLMFNRKAKQHQTSYLHKFADKVAKLCTVTSKFYQSDKLQCNFVRQISRLNKNKVILKDFLVKNSYIDKKQVELQFKFSEQQPIRIFIIQFAQPPQIALFEQNIQHLSPKDKLLIDQKIAIRMLASNQRISKHLQDSFNIKNQEETLACAIQICISSLFNKRVSSI